MPNPELTRFEGEPAAPRPVTTPGPLVDSRITTPRFALDDLIGLAVPVQVLRGRAGQQNYPLRHTASNLASVWRYHIRLRDEGLGALLRRDSLNYVVVPEGYELHDQGLLVVLRGRLFLEPGQWTTQGQRNGMLTLREVSF